MKSLAKRRGKALKFQTMNVVILITDQHAHQFLGCAGDIVDLQSRALDEFRYAFERAGQRRCTYKTRKWNTMMDRTNKAP